MIILNSVTNITNNLSIALFEISVSFLFQVRHSVNYRIKSCDPEAKGYGDHGGRHQASLLPVLRRDANGSVFVWIPKRFHVQWGKEWRGCRCRNGNGLMRTLKSVKYSQQNNVYSPRIIVKWQVVKSFAFFTKFLLYLSQRADFVFPPPHIGLKSCVQNLSQQHLFKYTKSMVYKAQYSLIDQRVRPRRDLVIKGFSQLPFLLFKLLRSKV